MSGRLVTDHRFLETLFSAASACGLSDAQLLERFVAGHDETSDAAFESLVLRHGPMVFDISLKVLGNAHDAQDAFQATFLILATRARSIMRRGSVASWLHGVALRVARRARTDAARRRAVHAVIHSATSCVVPLAAAKLATYVLKSMVILKIRTSVLELAAALAAFSLVGGFVVQSTMLQASQPQDGRVKKAPESWIGERVLTKYSAHLTKANDLRADDENKTIGESRLDLYRQKKAYVDTGTR